MYKNLKINVPKESMGFPNYPFDKHGDPSFIGHREVLEYIQIYAESTNVLPLIKLNSKVVSISATNDKKWNVKTNTNSYNFDFVIIANGHYTVPYIPDDFKSSSFEGKIIHSHFYRKPEDFAGKNVIG